MGVPSKRIDVGILGATGTVGQELIAQLDSHPWFNLTWLAGSHHSEGKRYAAAAHWRLAIPRPNGIGEMMVHSSTPDGAPRLVFSSLDAQVAGEIEGSFAAAGHTVISNARNYRMELDVPLLIPEINSEHLQLLAAQTARRSWAGRIVTNPNCSTIALAMALAPLQPFGLKTVNVSTLQAISGAGYPGVASLDIVGNVIPFIEGEEEKIQSETQKILGILKNGFVQPHPVVISAHCTRVPVVNGHSLLISVGFSSQPTADDLLEVFRAFSARAHTKQLPSAPQHPVLYLDEPDRPQPRFDVNRDGGMTVTIGRLRPCPVLDYKLVALSHNTVRGAAGAALLNAELMKVDGLLD